MNLALALTISCMTTIFENKTKFPWNENDEWNYQTALPKCQKLYPNSPCMKKFIKQGERDYRVICTGEV
jgi:hypothetical protein